MYIYPYWDILRQFADLLQMHRRGRWVVLRNAYKKDKKKLLRISAAALKLLKNKLGVKSQQPVFFFHVS
jgi:hypothetical protein